MASPIPEDKPAQPPASVAEPQPSRGSTSSAASADPLADKGAFWKDETLRPPPGGHEEYNTAHPEPCAHCKKTNTACERERGKLRCRLCEHRHVKCSRIPEWTTERAVAKGYNLETVKSWLAEGKPKSAEDGDKKMTPKGKGKSSGDSPAFRGPLVAMDVGGPIPSSSDLRARNTQLTLEVEMLKTKIAELEAKPLSIQSLVNGELPETSIIVRGVKEMINALGFVRLDLKRSSDSDIVNMKKAITKATGDMQELGDSWLLLLRQMQAVEPSTSTTSTEGIGLKRAVNSEERESVSSKRKRGEEPGDGSLIDDAGQHRQISV